MKHGPIALIDKVMSMVFIATQDRIYDKIVGNIEEVREVRARRAASSPSLPRVMPGSAIKRIM
ncbi:uncharacterized protein METZ01_LOCUS154711 [marine metagenome]|uniref:Glutamine--fructose-6-phosphate transaminase (isomerizing) n=1 Tax=marine metagenome TaxID=408172 RepID=A0A382ALI3_9ZZZZ